MSKGRFLLRVLTENRKFDNECYKQYLKPISRIKDDILVEAKKGNYSLEITGHLDAPVCAFFRDEGFIVQKDFDPDVTSIIWCHVSSKD